jgi:hypothetical protein
MSEKLLLWLDFETTGLNAASGANVTGDDDNTATDSVIEAAWMVTTGDLTQLTPLRSRITRLEPRESWARERTPLPDSEAWKAAWKAIKDSPETAPEVEEEVEGLYGVRPLVVRMHEETGLAEEFRIATGADSAAPGLRLLTTGGALEQLILDDLAEACEVYAADSIHLAGIGVSHFDHRVLAYHCPRLGTTNDGGLLHYRAFDPSVGRQIAGMDGSGDEYAAQMRERMAADLDAPSPCRMVEFDRPKRPDPGDGRPTNRVRISDLLRSTMSHRAADDVVEGLAWAEWLRRKFSDALTSRAS